MNLTYTRPGELRKPDVEVLPDGRIRITRFIAAGHGDRDYSEVTESVGTTDGGLATALLVKKGMARIEGKDAIVKTYEVRNPSTETAVGKEDVQFGENGLKTVIADFVQMSSGTYNPQTVGVTQSSYDPACKLRSETMEDDGTTRQIRRVYINKGLLSETNDTKNNGALFLKTLVYLNDASVPNPPSGYTLISQKTDNPGGIPTYTYVYAKGTGKVGQDDEVKNNGSLLIATIRYITTPLVSTNPIATPTGYVNYSYGYVDQDGHRIWTASYAKGNGKIGQSDETKLNGMLLRSTITWVTDPSVTSNPTSDPLGGSLVSQEYSDRDGYRIWTVTYAKGVSTNNISSTVEYKNNGKLAIYRAQRIDTAPNTPSATIGGTVVLIESTTQIQDGYTIYSNTWAEGDGQISFNTETKLNGMLLRGTIIHLTASSITSDPTTDPFGGSLKVSEEYAERDGYKIWTVVWVKAEDTNYIIDSVEYRNGNKQASYRRQRLKTAPVAPSPTIGGSVVLVESNVQTQDGYDLYTYSWAEGIGQVSRTDETKNNGALELASIRYFSATSVTSNPISTPSGYTIVNVSYADESGYRVWSATYAKGTGQISEESETRNNGSLLIKNIRYISTPSVASNPISTASGYSNITSSYADQDGFRIWSASYAKGNGEVSRSNETRLGGMLLRATIVSLTSSSTTTQPTSDPFSGGTIVSQEYSDRDGHRVWTVVWVYGDDGSNTNESIEYRNNGKLVIYSRQKLKVAPIAPSPTISGTVVLINETTRLEDGFTLYSKTWAEGVGVISESKEVHNQGKLVIYRKTSLKDAPTAPSATIGGTVVLIGDDSRQDSGVVIYDRRWAEGKGVIEKRTSPRDGGLRIETWVSIGQTYDSSFMEPTPGIVMAKDSDDMDGVTRWTVSSMQKSDGTDPTSGTALSYGTKRPFQYPGRAKAIATSQTLLSALRTSYDVYRSPPVDAIVDATVKVSYQSSTTMPSLANPLWNPTEWATIRAFYLAWNQYPKFVNESLPRYRAVSGTQTFNGGGTNGYQETCLGERVYGIGSGTPYSITVSGGPSSPDGNTYTIETPTMEPAFISYSGTQYYRVIIIEATIPAQPALPV